MILSVSARTGVGRQGVLGSSWQPQQRTLAADAELLMFVIDQLSKFMSVA